MSSQNNSELSSPPSAKCPRMNLEEPGWGSGADRAEPGQTMNLIVNPHIISHTCKPDNENGRDELKEEAFPITNEMLANKDTCMESYVIGVEGVSEYVEVIQHPEEFDPNQLKLYLEDNLEQLSALENTYFLCSTDADQPTKLSGCVAPSSDSLLTKEDENRAQVETNAAQTGAVSPTSSQFDCIGNGEVHAEDLCHIWRAFAEDGEELDFNENILFSVAESPTLCSDYPAAAVAVISEPEEISVTASEREGMKSDQVCESENLPVDDGETKGQENDSCISKTFAPAAAEHAEESILADGAMIGREIVNENRSPEISNHGEASNATDPAIKKNNFEWMHSYSDNTTDVGFSPEACKIETLLSFCSDQLEREGQKDEIQEEEKKACQFTETKSEIPDSHFDLDRNGNKGNCQPTGSPITGFTKPTETPDAEGLKPEEQSRCSSSPLCPHYMNTVDIELPHSATDKNEAEAEEQSEIELFHYLQEVDDNAVLFEAKKDGDQPINKKIQQAEEELVQNGEYRQHVSALPFKPGVCQSDIKTECHETDEVIKNRRETEHLEVPTVIDNDKEQKSVVSEDRLAEWTTVSRMTTHPAFDENDQVQPPTPSCDHQLESSTAENEDQLSALVFPSANDAVVPCPLDLSHSVKKPQQFPVFKINDRARSFSCRALRGFDEFEKIRLSQDDDPVFPVLTETLQNPSVRCKPLDEENTTKEGTETFDINNDNTPTSVDSSDFTCNEAPNELAADVVSRGSAEQQPNSGSVHAIANTKESNTPAVSATLSETPCYTQFEMKEQFGRVLKELNLFFDISRSEVEDDCRPPSPLPYSSEQALQSSAPEPGKYLSSPELGSRDASTATLPPESGGEIRRLAAFFKFLAKSVGLESRKHVNDEASLKMCEHDPVLSVAAVSSDGEQEVPLNINMRKERSTDKGDKLSELEESKRKEKTWSPTFMYLPLSEQLNQRAPEMPKRLEPLKTCIRPIRVGLSKRAKIKHLHRSHPYC